MHSKRGDEVAKALEYFLEQDFYRKISTDRGSELVNPNVKKVLLKYNTMLYHSHSPIKVALAGCLIKTIRILILIFCTLKNTAAFIQDADKNHVDS